MPEISVLLPVHNAAAWIERTIGSVLGQTYGDIELIVVDDASTDGSRDLVLGIRDPRLVLVVNETRLGLTRTLNRGLALARGGLVARQDADDVSLPERLDRQVAFLRARPDVALLGTCGFLIDAEGRIQAPLDHAREHRALLWELLFDNGFLHTSVLFRRDVVQKLGGYDESFEYCQDRDLWCRLSEVRRVANLGERLVLSRYHPAGMTALMGERGRVENRRITPRHLRAVLGRGASDGEVEALARGREGPLPSELPQLLARLRGLLEEYSARFPGLEQDPDFKDALGRQCARLALSGPPRLRRLFAVGRGAPAGSPWIAAVLRECLWRAWLLASGARA